MTFPLMRGYDHINIVRDLEPAAAVRDKEIGERIARYSKLVTAGAPDFGHAVQVGSEWRIGTLGSGDPAGARYSLAASLRMGAEKETDTEVGGRMRAAADRLDPEDGEQLPKDEWEIGPRRYRVIRVENFALIGGGAMEPPRPADYDLTADSMLRGHPIDPRAPAGQWEAQLRINLVGYLPVPGTVPEMVHTEARHAIQTHAGVVLLPPSFTAVEIEGDSWKPVTGGCRPDEARTNLARHFTELLPRLREFQGDPPSAAETADWTRACEEISAARGHEFHTIGRRFRIVRVSRMLRLGRDGPEAPRPSDQDRYGWPPPGGDED